MKVECGALRSPSVTEYCKIGLWNLPRKNIETALDLSLRVGVQTSALWSDILETLGLAQWSPVRIDGSPGNGTVSSGGGLFRMKLTRQLNLSSRWLMTQWWVISSTDQRIVSVRLLIESLLLLAKIRGNYLYISSTSTEDITIWCPDIISAIYLSILGVLLDNVCLLSAAVDTSSKLVSIKES